MELFLNHIPELKAIGMLALGLFCYARIKYVNPKPQTTDNPTNNPTNNSTQDLINQILNPQDLENEKQSPLSTSNNPISKNQSQLSSRHLFDISEHEENEEEEQKRHSWKSERKSESRKKRRRNGRKIIRKVSKNLNRPILRRRTAQIVD